ncbi:MAG: oligosaccharide repeat unit polymerase [Candidatus Hydrothermarchaeales archaeon]
MRSIFLSAVFDSSSFIKRSFEDSITLQCILAFLDFLESAFSRSLVRKVLQHLSSVYPKRLWSYLDRINSRLGRGVISGGGIFNPLLIFPLVYLGFVGISSYRLSNLALASIGIGIGFFMLGAVFSKMAKFGDIYLDASSRRIAVFLLAVGISFLAFDLLYVGSIPLLDPLARRYLSVTYTMLASLTVPGSILMISLMGIQFRRGNMTLGEARVYAVFVMLATTFLMSLLGYRTQMLVSLLGCVIAMYQTEIIGPAEILLAFFAAIFGISSVGYLRALQEGGSIAFFDIIGKRIGLTLSIYDWLVNRFWVFGVNHGSVALATFSSFLPIPGSRFGPRTIVARIFGIKGISMTSTLFGTVVLDFGIPGIVVFAFAFGIVVGAAYQAVKQTKSALTTAVFSLFMAYTLIGIETGLVDFNVAMFFFAGIVILINSIENRIQWITPEGSR